MRREADLLYELDETINQLLLADRPAVVVDLLDLELGSHILAVSQPNKNHCSLATCLGVLLRAADGATGWVPYSHVIPGLDEQAAATVARLILEGSDTASKGSPGSDAANSAAKRTTPPTPERR